MHGQCPVRPPCRRAGQRPGPGRTRAGEALVVDWTSLAFCCAVAGEISLRPTTLQEVQRSSVYVPLRSGDGPLVVAHRRAYPLLVGRNIEIDCRRRLGVRWFSSSLPPALGLRMSFGREPAIRPDDHGKIRLRALMLRSADTPISPEGSWISQAMR